MLRQKNKIEGGVGNVENWDVLIHPQAADITVYMPYENPQREWYSAL